MCCLARERLVRFHLPLPYWQRLRSLVEARALERRAELSLHNSVVEPDVTALLDTANYSRLSETGGPRPEAKLDLLIYGPAWLLVIASIGIELIASLSVAASIGIGLASMPPRLSRFQLDPTALWSLVALFGLGEMIAVARLF